ncbi:MAG: hypothetical protein IMZ52_06235 [Actinobacteria bacterium]|nr:hypothetical protein [Actinomycetota bacterium]MBE3114664.1 hypothetical protein [Actinomycetota bacterium]
MDDQEWWEREEFGITFNDIINQFKKFVKVDWFMLVAILSFWIGIGIHIFVRYSGHPLWENLIALLFLSLFCGGILTMFLGLVSFRPNRPNYDSYKRCKNSCDKCKLNGMVCSYLK